MKVTESDSNYTDIEKMEVSEIIKNINEEDKTVASAVEKCLPQIEALILAASKKINNGGRLFYIGSGTSGRLGILDASECPPTYGVDRNMVIGLIAGGDTAIRTAVENAEDEVSGGWNDLKKYNISKNDFVVGISSSGTTPYVVGAMQNCFSNGIETACITSNPVSPLAKEVKYPVEAITGPEFVTGSTRMKEGNAQIMILNMISTTIMIKFGRILGNKMVDMQLNNKKLIIRGAKIIAEKLSISEKKAEQELIKLGSVRKVLNNYK